VNVLDPVVAKEPVAASKLSTLVEILDVNDTIEEVNALNIDGETALASTALVKCDEPVFTLTPAEVMLIPSPASTSKDTEPALPPPVRPSPANTAEISPVPATFDASHTPAEALYCNTFPFDALSADAETLFKPPKVVAPPPPPPPGQENGANDCELLNPA